MESIGESRFDSYIKHPLKLAHLVEQSTHHRFVAGSNPALYPHPRLGLPGTLLKTRERKLKTGTGEIPRRFESVFV